MRCCNREMKVDKITSWNEALVHCNKCGRADHYPMKKETMKIYLKPGQSFKFDNGFEVEVVTEPIIKNNAGYHTITDLESISKLTNALHEIARYKEHEPITLWSAPSHTKNGESYLVNRYISHWECACPDFKYRSTSDNNHECKHIREKKSLFSYSEEKALREVTQIAKEALGLK